MAKWQGIGNRIRQRLRELGYWNSRTGRADVLRFSLDHRYVAGYVYKWLGDTVPDPENILRLAKDLQCSPAWLLLGEEGGPPPAPAVRVPPTPAPIQGGSSNGGTLPVATLEDRLLLIGRWLRTCLGFSLDRMPIPQAA
jgi:hypothetical protein